MRVLIVKTSSLGDLVHTLPAITDAADAIPNFTCDWVVEKNFAELPRWHQSVQNVIPIELRRWRSSLVNHFINCEILSFLRQLRAHKYDKIIDAQGLFKSALITNLARGPSSGLDRYSAREPWISWSYRQQIKVPLELHAIHRIRCLFAETLGYKVPTGILKYGLHITAKTIGRPYLVFLPATTWASKRWPIEHWAELVRLAVANNYQVFIAWHSQLEQQNATAIIKQAQNGELLPNQGLSNIASWLAGATGVVGVDTGLTHLATAIGKPVVALYGPTSSGLTGVVGPRQRNLTADNNHCTPCRRRICKLQPQTKQQPVSCLSTISPLLTWDTLQQIII